MRLQLIFRDGAVERLTAAFYAVLELSIPLGKLRNDFVWTRRSLARWIALAEAHQVPGEETVPPASPLPSVGPPSKLSPGVPQKA